MKEFVSVFFAFLIFGGAFILFFAGYIFNNFLLTFLFIAFLSAVLITIIIKLAIKVEELEEKVNSFLNQNE